MSANRYDEMERIIQDQGERGLEVMEYYYGMDLEILRPNRKGDVYGQVHGSDSGGPTNLFKVIRGVLQGDDFLPSNNSHSGNFETGFLFTKDKDILVGDVINIRSRDDKQRRFKVVERQQIGFTTEIFTKWKLSSIGD
jgi:hypothetical protein